MTHLDLNEVFMKYDGYSFILLWYYWIFFLIRRTQCYSYLRRRFPSRYFSLTLRSKVVNSVTQLSFICQWHSPSQHYLKITIVWLTQFKDLQWHGEARLLGSHQRPVTGAEVLTGRQEQQHGQLFTKLQQLPGVHTILICLSEKQGMADAIVRI